MSYAARHPDLFSIALGYSPAAGIYSRTRCARRGDGDHQRHRGRARRRPARDVLRQPSHRCDHAGTEHPHNIFGTLARLPVRIAEWARLRPRQALASGKAGVTPTRGAEGFPTVVDGPAVLISDDLQAVYVEAARWERVAWQGTCFAS